MALTATRRNRAHTPTSFLIALERMSEAGRLRASTQFDAHQRAVWAAHFPEEVPLLNGEHKWITLTSADLD